MKIPIRFNFFTTKHGIALAFLSDISNWNTFYVHRERKKAWLSFVGKLDSREKKALKAFSLLMRKYSPKVEKAFFFSKKEEEAFKKLPPPAAKQLQKIFALFDIKINKIWQSESIHLKKKASLMRSKTRILEKTIKDVTYLFSPKFTEKEYLIFLSLSSPLSAESAGWFWGDNKISLECSNVPNSQINFLIGGILLHKLIHAWLRDSVAGQEFFAYTKRRKLSLLKRWAKKTKLPVAKLYEEILVSSLAPEGYLYRKHFGLFRQPQTEPLNRIRSLTGSLMSSMLQEYIKQKKILDVQYFDALLQTPTNTKLNRSLLNHS